MTDQPVDAEYVNFQEDSQEDSQVDSQVGSLAVAVAVVDSINLENLTHFKLRWNFWIIA